MLHSLNKSPTVHLVFTSFFNGAELTIYLTAEMEYSTHECKYVVINVNKSPENTDCSACPLSHGLPCCTAMTLQ